jgi:hypothetical protein
MKKIISILFLLILIFISCEKMDNDSTTVNIPTSINSVADLDGTWEFQKFTHPVNGELTTCPEPFGDVMLSLIFKNSKCTIIDSCTGIIKKDYKVFLEGKAMNLKPPQPDPYSYTYSFSIKSYNAPILELGRRFSNPQGGEFYTTLTLKKIK